MICILPTHQLIIVDQWIGFVGKFYRNPPYFIVEKPWFPVKISLKQIP